MNKKSFANIILIVVIVILLGAVGYFAFVKKSEPIAQQPTPTPTLTPTQTTTPTKTPISPTPTPKGQVTINTNKTEYTKGEEVKAELVFEETIYEWGEDGYSIQKWEDGLWKDIFIRRGCSSLPDCKNANLEEVKECLGYKLCERPIWYKLEKDGEGNWRASWIWDQTSGKEKSYQCRKVNYEWSGGERVPIYGGVVKERCIDFQQVPVGKYKIKFEYATAINPEDQFDRNVEIQYTEREFLIK